MTTLTAGEFKSKFSAVLGRVQRGEKVGVRLGRGKEAVAVLVPAHRASAVAARRLGPLAGKAKFRVKAGFKMTDEELLGR